ncbi:MAG: DUF4369 domain-containing protein [Draconibacterium sp.]
MAKITYAKTMNYLRFFSVLLLVTALFQSCENNKKSWQLNGTSETGSRIYLYKLKPEVALIDSAKVDQHKFSFSGQNDDERFEVFLVTFDKRGKNGINCLIANGDKMNITLNDKMPPVFSGTEISDDLNRYYNIKQQEKKLNFDLSKELEQTQLSEEARDQTMISYREKVQNLENEKIAFLKSITHADLNAYLVLKELENSGVVEKEVIGKYRDALTAEGALTNSGIEVHRIYEFYDAYAISREMDILDTATIRQRYNALNEENKSSVYARRVLDHLNKMR